jgi:opacity protein-like surface antigen
MRKLLFLYIAIWVLPYGVFAGNPDRIGQGGAYELLINPWARTGGLHGLMTASVSGVDAFGLNPAGIARINKTQLVVSRTNYMQGSTLSLNAAGLGIKLGEKSTLAISLNSLNFGDIEITTTDNPEGIGASYSPTFSNLAVAYSRAFTERITVGLCARFINERTTNVSANGISLDAGVQYHTEEGFKLGISLRNVGPAVRYGGEGLSFLGSHPPTQDVNTDNYTVALRPDNFELPSQLNIGMAYDLKFAEDAHRITVLANFTANSFTKDQYGLGLEYSMKEMFTARVGYQYEDGLLDDALRTNIHTGLSAGASLQVPFKKGGDQKIGVDYAYRTTSPFDGTHQFGIRLDF